MIFEVPGPPKAGPKRVQNGSRIASSTWKPSESLLRAFWSALGGSWNRKKVVRMALGRSYNAFGAENTPQTPRLNLIKLWDRKAQDAIICLRPVIICNHLPTPCNHLPTSHNHLPMSVQSSAYVRAIISLRPVSICLQTTTPKLVRKWIQITPGSPQMAPKWLQNRSWSLLESSWSCLGSLEASWRPLGRLLEASRAEKKIL